MVWQRATSTLWAPAYEEHSLASGHHHLDSGHKLIIAGATGSGRRSLAAALCVTEKHAIHEATLAVSTTRYFALGQLFPHASLDTSSTVGAVVQQLQAHLRANNSAGFTAVVLNAQLADQESLVVVALLAESQHLKLILTCHRVAAHRISQLVRANSAIVEVGPLTIERGTALLAQRFSIPPHPQAVNYLLDRSNLNYRLFVGLADALDRSGALAEFDGILTVFGGDVHTLNPDAVTWDDWWLIARDTDPEGRDLIDVLALVGSADLFEIMAIFPADLVDSYLELRVLRLDKDSGSAHPSQRSRPRVVSLSSQLRADLTAASLSIPRRFALYRKYAGQLAVIRPSMAVRMAEWAVSSNQPISLEIKRMAAKEANRQGRYALAEKLLTGSLDGDALLTFSLAYALVALDRIQDALALMRGVNPDLLDQDSYWNYCLLTQMTSSRKGGPELKWPTLTATGLDYRGKLAVNAVMNSIAEMIAGRALVFEAAPLALKDLSTHNRMRVLIWSSEIALATGQVARAQVLSGQALVISDELLPQLSKLDLEMLYGAAVLILIEQMRYAEAEQSLRRFIALTHSDERSRGRIDAYLSAVLDLRRGRLPFALASTKVFLKSLDTGTLQLRGQAESLRALLLTMCTDDTAAAEEQLRLARQHPHTRKFSFDLIRRGNIAVAEAGLGRPEIARTELRQALDDAEVARIPLAQIDLAVALVAIDDWEQLPRLESAANHAEGTAPVKVWRQLIVAINSGDVATMDRLADELDKASNVYDSSRVAQISLRAITHFKLTATSAQLTRLTRAARAISASSNRTDSRQILEERLTKRELEIADLIIQNNLTDPEIAARLGLSVRTVNAHVRNILAKLKVTGRGELGRYAAPG